MEVSMTDIILVFITGWIATVSGVILGGFLVFRTKREQYDPLFSSGKPPKGEAFVLGDDGTEVQPTEIPDMINNMNKRFVDTFADRLESKYDG